MSASVFARSEVRYDLTTSQSEWPNFRQQSWSIKRWPLLNKRLQDSGIHWQDVLNATDDRTFMDELLAFRYVAAQGAGHCPVFPTPWLRAAHDVQIRGLMLDSFVRRHLHHPRSSAVLATSTTKFDFSGARGSWPNSTMADVF